MFSTSYIQSELDDVNGAKFTGVKSLRVLGLCKASCGEKRAERTDSLVTGSSGGDQTALKKNEHFKSCLLEIRHLTNWHSDEVISSSFCAV